MKVCDWGLVERRRSAEHLSSHSFDEAMFFAQMELGVEDYRFFLYRFDLEYLDRHLADPHNDSRSCSLYIFDAVDTEGASLASAPHGVVASDVEPWLQEDPWRMGKRI